MWLPFANYAKLQQLNTARNNMEIFWNNAHINKPHQESDKFENFIDSAKSSTYKNTNILVQIRKILTFQMAQSFALT